MKKYYWEKLSSYLDIELNDGNNTRKKKFLTLREFKEKIENGNSLDNIVSEGFNKKLVSFFNYFSQNNINLTYEDFRKDYDNGKSLQEIGKKYNVSTQNMNFLRQLYQIKRLGTGYAKRKRNDVKLTSRQREIIYGTLMGDAKRQISKENCAILGIKHSYKQKEYVEWKYKELESLIVNKTIRKEESFDKRYNKTYIRFFFTIQSNSEILEINNQFYGGGGKREVSEEILKNLTPLSIAVWFMDDGYCDKSKYEVTNLIFCTDSFSEKSCNNIIKWFREEWGITAFLRERPLQNRIGYRIVVKSDSTQKLIKMIEPYIVPSLKYKIINSNKINKPKSKPKLVKSSLQPDDNFPEPERYNFLTKEILIKDYIENGFSDRDLAFRYSVSKTRIWKKRQEFNIKR